MRAVRLYKGTRGTICLKSPLPPSLAEPLLGADRGDAVCRICMQQPDGLLLSPCWCTGSIQHICDPCLRQWRSNNRKCSESCELCGVAFQYEFERVPWRGRLLVAATRSWRCFALLVCAIVCQLQYLGVFSVIPCHVSTFVVVGIAFELCYDLYRYVSQDRLGTLGYSLKRLLRSSDLDEEDLWQLHLVEWVRTGISPVKRKGILLPCASIRKHFSGSLLAMMGVFVFILFFDGTVCLLLHCKWLEDDRVRAFEASTGKYALTLGLVYLIGAVLLHVVSACCKPSLRLITDPDAKPRVRSLLAHEKRGRAVASV